MSGQTRGWCPGALKPMRTGDGLLVRVRLTGGILSPALAISMAQAARDFGNGLFDLTSRANLQMRGVRDAALQPLLNRLSDLGLLDDSAEAEQVRNVMASPLAGLDKTALIDVGPLAESLERRLTSDADFHALPAKFGFLVDGGGLLTMDGVEADIGLRAVDAGHFRLTAGEVELGLVTREDAVKAALETAARFLRLRHPDDLRMRDQVRRLQGGTQVPSPGFVGKADLRAGYLSPFFFAAAAPFGRITADQLEGLAGLSETLRLTPWRAIILASSSSDLALRVASLGLVTDPTDPRLAISACPGSPSCLSGEVSAQVDAARLAPVLASFIGEGASVHLSGCTKGCARRAPASLMLIGKEGRYALAFDADSRATSTLPLMDVDEIAAYLAKSAAQNSFKSSDHV